MKERANPFTTLIAQVRATKPSSTTPPWLASLEGLMPKVGVLLDIPAAVKQLTELEHALASHDVHIVIEAEPARRTQALETYQRIFAQRRSLARAVHGDGYALLALEVERMNALASLGLLREACVVRMQTLPLARVLRDEDAFRHPSGEDIAMREALLQGDVRSTLDANDEAESERLFLAFGASMPPSMHAMRDEVRSLRMLKRVDEARALRKVEALVTRIEVEGDTDAARHVRDWLRPIEWSPRCRAAVEEMSFALEPNAGRQAASDDARLRRLRGHAEAAADLPLALELTQQLLATSDPESETHLLDRHRALELRSWLGQDVEAELRTLILDAARTKVALYAALALLRGIVHERGDAKEELRIALQMARAFPYRAGDDDLGLDRAIQALDLARLFLRADRPSDARAQIERGLRGLPSYEQLLRFDLHAERARIELAVGEHQDAKRAVELASACAIEGNAAYEAKLKALRVEVFQTETR